MEKQLDVFTLEGWLEDKIGLDYARIVHFVGTFFGIADWPDAMLRTYAIYKMAVESGWAEWYVVCPLHETKLHYVAAPTLDRAVSLLSEALGVTPGVPYAFKALRLVR